MNDATRPPFAGGQFDRDAATRMNDASLDAAWNDEEARLLHLADGEVLICRQSDESLRLALTKVSSPRSNAHLYLGRLNGAPLFAKVSGRVTEERDIVEARLDTTPATETEWVSPFACAAELQESEASALAAALALSAWHASMGFSPRDGSPTEVTQGGWVRRDPHGGEHFPRTDPVVIVLIEHDGKLLLGSNALWERDRFSLLAGFIEAGESAEHAVEREIFEEAGLRLSDIRYVASQPWPFPRSLMLGFRARLAAGVDPHSFVADPEEISELRWFTADELRHPNSLILPRSLSIARWLIDGWLAEQTQLGASADESRGAGESPRAGESRGE